MKVWFPYWEWEDYQAGMYGEFDESKVQCAAAVLGDPERFYGIASLLHQEWPKATMENLTNQNCNRRAWVGWAACCVATGASERTTRKAWSITPAEKQVLANAVADRVIGEFTHKHCGLHQQMGGPMLFGRDTRRRTTQASATRQSPNVPADCNSAAH